MLHVRPSALADRREVEAVALGQELDLVGTELGRRRHRPKAVIRLERTAPLLMTSNRWRECDRPELFHADLPALTVGPLTNREPRLYADA